MSENQFTPSEEKISRAVDRSKTKAEEYLHDPDKTRNLVEEAVRKTNAREPGSTINRDFWSQLKAFNRMLKAYITKQYTVVPWGSIAMVTGTIIYFVSPIDLVLDWIPVAGLVDDAAVMVFVFRQVSNDIEKFQNWEADRESPGQQVIDL